ncbi:MAG: hypothetical protein KGI38_13115 [Thaumarchaeota archaeon]|nr:hypothetical protein [Nitrososphaerota archaeon]
MKYKPIPFATDSRDMGMPEVLLRKVEDVSDETLEGAIERHPAAWLMMTAKRAEKRKVGRYGTS